MVFNREASFDDEEDKEKMEAKKEKQLADKEGTKKEKQLDDQNNPNLCSNDHDEKYAKSTPLRDEVIGPTFASDPE